MTRIVVCDTGPLLHLSEAGAIHLLSSTGKVIIPPLVAIEFESNAQGWLPPQWVRQVPLRRATRQKAEKWVRAKQIDAGEAEAIGLPLQEQAEWFLTDDAKARQFVESLGVEVHGSIAILLWSVANERIHEKAVAVQLLENLANSSLWISACSSLTSVIIPNSVTNIGDGAFSGCTSMASVMIPNTLTRIGDSTFANCESLISITIPRTVSYIGDRAFSYCTSLTGLYFQGDAPGLGSDVFLVAGSATVCYLPGTIGWGTTFGDRPADLWVLPYPLILSFGSSFGVQASGFGFIISWATNVPVVVEACNNLANREWLPIHTNILIKFMGLMP